MVRYAVILAGGAGTRLWPASVKAHPKQFLKIAGEKTLLQLTVERALALGVEAILIVTHQSQTELVAEDVAQVHLAKPITVILAEPVARNTAAALALAARYLGSIGKADETCIVMPADHIVTPTSAFVADTAYADALARQGYLLTYGIDPTRPETGYGYIETSERLQNGWKVNSFREKPDHATAIHYLKAGNYFWNSGMFVYRTDVFLEELSRFAPAVAEPFNRLTIPFPVRTVHGVRVAGDVAALSALYPSIDAVSVDYALMEKSDRGAMVQSSFRWNDVGSWDEIAAISESAEVSRKSELGLPSGDVPAVRVESPGCYIDSDLPVAVCGVEDVHVVVKNGMVLVCKRGSSQLVKDAFNLLRDGGYERLL